jgi:hypothetical protein
MCSTRRRRPRIFSPACRIARNARWRITVYFGSPIPYADRTRWLARRVAGGTGADPWHPDRRRLRRERRYQGRFTRLAGNRPQRPVTIFSTGLNAWRCLPGGMDHTRGRWVLCGMGRCFSGPALMGATGASLVGERCDRATHIPPAVQYCQREADCYSMYRKTPGGRIPRVWVTHRLLRWNR